MSRFKDWYDRGGKERLAEKRKARYKADPEYRAKAKQSAKVYRGKTRDAQPEAYSVEFSDAAARLAISTATLRAWARKGWYPAPLVYGRHLWFTEQQVEYLQSIAGFLNQHKHDLKNEAIRLDFDIKVQLVHLNWS